MDKLKRFWRFLKEDSWQSWIVSLVLLIVLIRLVIFPFLSFATGSSLPLVVVESCSMFHQENFDDWWFKNRAWYLDHDITKEQFEEFTMKNGFNKGDIIIVWGHSTYEKGDIIIFQPNSEANAAHPIIHRIVAEDPFGTKGDNNNAQLNGQNQNGIDETNIAENQIVGKSILRIPKVGWVKLVFFEIAKDISKNRQSNDHWFCR